MSLFRTEGAGKTGRRLAPMVRVQQKSTRQNHRLSRNRPAFPAQWCYGLYVISPVTRLCCHRHQHDAKHHRQLNASLGAPGPHDFAVRGQRHSSDDMPRPSHPAPNVRDDREAPLMWVRDARRIVLICPTAQEKMCTTGSLRIAGMRTALSTSLRARATCPPKPKGRRRKQSRVSPPMQSGLLRRCRSTQ